MGQHYKAVYFTDYQEHHEGCRSMTLAFSEPDAAVFQQLRYMSSHQVRELIGSHAYSDVLEQASAAGEPLNSFCLGRIREALSGGSNGQHLAVDPLQVTFKGGAQEPGHAWYSYLEGYSPKFVRHVIEEFGPDARTIYDPFGGVGTTPVTASEAGLLAFYCELNPFLRDLADAKVAARLASRNVRTATAQALEGIAADLSGLLADSGPDEDLRAAYANTFRASRFFDPETFELVLRARTLLDREQAEDALVGQMLGVAIGNSLIPASLLQRAGDIRYKSAREIERRPDFAGEVSRNLRRLAVDLPLLASIQHQPTLLSADAKELGDVNPPAIDLVVTSPPYLNGTNYFRNTKVELWFSRHIRTAADLAALRKKAVTAGINDVTKDKGHQYSTPEVEDLVVTVAANAYDKRIPRMIAQYFCDMSAVFRSLAPRLSKGATVAIDIGDSIYGGVHVATDRLLVGVLSRLGYSLRHDITLRTRNSYNGEVLRQALLVFEFSGLGNGSGRS